MIVVGSQGSGIRGGQVVSSQELVVSELLKQFLTFDKNCISNFWREEESMIPLNCKSAICRNQGFSGTPSPNYCLLAPDYLHGGRIKCLKKL